VNATETEHIVRTHDINHPKVSPLLNHLHTLYQFFFLLELVIARM
jgi:hypothetical protein